MEVIYSIWSARDILKAQVENVIQSLIPGSTYVLIHLVNYSVNMDALVRIRFGIVHLVFDLPLIDFRKQIAISSRFPEWCLMMKTLKTKELSKRNIVLETTI